MGRYKQPKDLWKPNTLPLRHAKKIKHFSKFLVSICQFSRFLWLIEKNSAMAILVFWIMPAHVACQFSRNEVGNGKSLFFYWRKHLHRTWFVSWNSPKIGWPVFVFRKKNHKLHHRTSGRTLISGPCIELLGVKWAGFSSAISACEKNGHWQIALKILTESLSSKRSATVIGWTFFFRKIF